MKPDDEATATPHQRVPLDVSRIRPAYQQVGDQLRQLILSGELSPGDRLPVEAELAAGFGVSRSTVREALRTLSSQSLIHTVRGVAGGTFVSETDPDSISEFLETRLGLLTGHDMITAGELLEARQLLEVPAARFAASRRRPEQIAAMRLAIEHEKDESERLRRFAVHQHFHGLILDAAANRLLDVMTVPVFRVIRARFTHDVASSEYWRKVDKDHLEILERIEKRDADGAARAMEEHLSHLRAVYSQAEGAPDAD